MVEKFQIHSQDNVAKKLDNLSKKFLKTKLKTNVPEVHHGVLSFLLSTSQNPLENRNLNYKISQMDMSFCREEPTDKNHMK